MNILNLTELDKEQLICIIEQLNDKIGDLKATIEHQNIKYEPSEGFESFKENNEQEYLNHLKIQHRQITVAYNGVRAFDLTPLIRLDFNPLLNFNRI